MDENDLLAFIVSERFIPNSSSVRSILDVHIVASSLYNKGLMSILRFLSSSLSPFAATVAPLTANCKILHIYLLGFLMTELSFVRNHHKCNGCL